MESWIIAIYEEMKDIIEVELSLEKTIVNVEKILYKDALNISQFYDRYIEPLSTINIEKTDIYRYFNTSNIYNSLVAKYKPAERTKKIQHEYALLSILALRFEETDLMFQKRNYDIKELGELRKTFQRINFKNSKAISEIERDKINIENKYIPHKDMVNLYNYFIEEIHCYPNDFEKLKNIVYLENDSAFVLYNESLRFINLAKVHKGKYKDEEFEEKMGDIFEMLFSLDLPWVKLKIMRLINLELTKINKTNKNHFTLNSLLEEIRLLFVNVKDILDRLYKTIIVNENMRLAYIIKPLDFSNHISLEIIEDHKYKRNSWEEYYNLLKNEFEMIWIDGRDFNDRNQKMFNRILKKRKIDLYGFF
ncbi:hypothetical protein [Mammaliicoccus lentus]|uniref:hypothetical protein n=1 Tax=Mammaliicoccus lentus TaxID=42858 RepID=UPI002DBA111C|nr:hypothetical protein [Mammaliicoccus lentus]MEB8090985.1 hypothetical protein [Mammaliicoccus lentus]